jgi:ferredoxin
MQDIQVKVTDLEGVVHELDIPTDMGLNLMEAIKAHGLQVKATCGGMAMCATCHVLVLNNHPLPERSEDEEAMLDEAFLLDDDRSRLSCQLQVNDKLHGIEVQLGESTGE